MSLINQLRNIIGTRILHQFTRSHPLQRAYTSLQDAKEIGILYDGLLLENEALIHKYAVELRSQGKKVFLLGYVDLKTLPGNKKFTLQSEYYSKEKLTPFNLPDKSKIGRFLEMEFDLLLNLYVTPILPMLALSAYARAKYRVGPNMPDGTEYMDAMIDTGNNNDIRFLIKQIDFYLRTIK
ncbi:MAG: hypothetical protein WC760_02250 [Bacteroidia bacterium]|jgi:hypothetical protein